MAVANAAILRKKRRGCEVEEDADFSEVYSIKQRTEIVSFSACLVYAIKS